MTIAFDKALSFVLDREGGYVNNPKDPGGMTNLGVTKAVWEAWTGKPASEAIMRALTRATVAPLYKSRYWDTVKGDQLPGPLALCVFDFGVNAGPARAALYLQRAVGATQDGAIGPKTLAAVQQAATAKGLPALVTAYCNARRDYYRSLSTFETFGRGWLNRVDEVQSAALALVS